jgi:hypothetical protein
VAGKLQPYFQEKDWRLSVARGCLQGGIPLPLLWSMVVDKLKGGLNENGYYTVGYADDIAILIREK